MFAHQVAYSLHFSYYGPGTIPSVEDTIDLFAVESLTTDTEIEEKIALVGRTDPMEATARGVGPT